MLHPVDVGFLTTDDLVADSPLRCVVRMDSDDSNAADFASIESLPRLFEELDPGLKEGYSLIPLSRIDVVLKWGMSSTSFFPCFYTYETLCHRYAPFKIFKKNLPVPLYRKVN
jgi:hypothetical protein